MLATIVALLAIATANPYPTMTPMPELSPPPFPANGTYAYGIFHGKQRVGKTMVVVLRHSEDNRIDIFESGKLSNQALLVHGGLAYADLQPAPWDVTYIGFPLPNAGKWREKYPPQPRFTVRYQIDQDGGYDEVDGIKAGDVWPLWSFPDRKVLYWTVVNPPFMAGAMTIPAELQLRRETSLLALSEVANVFGATFGMPMATVTASKTFSGRWPHDTVIGNENFQLSYDPATMLVHGAWYKKSDVTVLLDSQTPNTAAAISFGTP